MSFLESRAALALQGIGKSVPRREDARLLTGRGRYADDFSLPGQAYCCLVRSPHAHAEIVTIDAAEVSGVPGVLAVLTGSDAANDGLRQSRTARCRPTRTRYRYGIATVPTSLSRPIRFSL